MLTGRPVIMPIGPRFPGQHLGTQLALPGDFELLSLEVFDCARIVLASRIVSSCWRLEAVLHKGGFIAWIESRASKSLHLPLGGTLDISMVPTSGTPIGPTGIYITV